MQRNGLKVAKFGGTSLADAACIRRVARIVKKDPSRRFIVVSAPGKRHPEDEKITDRFLQWVNAEGAAKKDLLDRIQARFESIVTDLGLTLDVEKLFDKIEREGGVLARNKTLLRDYALSRGEWLSAQIVAAVLGFEFIDSADFIVFNRHGFYDSVATQKRANTKKLKNKARRGVVIPGFYGTIAGTKTIRTFPRGGSDITGAIVAALVNATEYENWTDVLGIRMADPRIVKDPKKIRTMTYRELRELMLMGGNVFHEDAVPPVRAVGIPIHVRSTWHPTQEGTRIVSRVSKPGHTITGIAGKNGFSVITMLKYGMNNEVGFMWRALGVFNKLNVSIEHVPGTVDSLSFVVESKSIEGRRDVLLKGLTEACNPDQIRVTDDVALICTVGLGMAQTPSIAGVLCEAIGKKGIATELISQGGSKINIVIGVKESEASSAINAIYDAFVR